MSTKLVLVENTGDTFESRFDGRIYTFKKGVKVPLSIEAAQHIFGFGLANRMEVFTRHGWMSKSTEYEKCQKEVLGKFKFSFGEEQIVEDTPQLEVQEQERPHIAPVPLLEAVVDAETAGCAPDCEAPTEQRSAPLQPGAEGEAGGSEEPEEEQSAPTPYQQPGQKGSMLDSLTTG